ncbi:transposase [uncultured Bacteroides sp.]|uniref:ISAon1 family transposase N-terminal region protein n=1 Tax=uncultured Bacteroides sp. TaxID=162156 RepID=UPI002AAC0DD9|nr:transposase [uncultured Bacteroides sp.]
MFLPLGLLDYFDLVNSESLEACLILFLKEKNFVPKECKTLPLHSKGFMPEIEVQDFSVRGKAVYLRIKRSRWEDIQTGKTYSRDLNLVATGTRITAHLQKYRE